jgi:two-component system, response regulator PdtaR
MRQSLARFSGPESSPQIRSLADFIATTSGFSFSVHTPAMGVVPLQELDMGPIRVLLVEDELFVRIDIAATLRHAGFQVIEAACADAAMEFIESGEPIDLVFTDIQTPGTLDGLALAERVRAKYPLMPVLICSGNPELEGAASRLGKFVPKPYEPTGVVRLITSSIR